MRGHIFTSFNNIAALDAFIHVRFHKRVIGAFFCDKEYPDFVHNTKHFYWRITEARSSLQCCQIWQSNANVRGGWLFLDFICLNRNISGNTARLLEDLFDETWYVRRGTKLKCHQIVHSRENQIALSPNFLKRSKKNLVIAKLLTIFHFEITHFII